MSDSTTLHDLKRMILGGNVRKDSVLRELEIDYVQHHEDVQQLSLAGIVKFTRDLDDIMRYFVDLVEDDYVNIAYNAFLYNQEGIRRIEAGLGDGSLAPNGVIRDNKTYFHARAGELAREIYYKTGEKDRTWAEWWYYGKVEAADGFRVFNKDHWAHSSGSAGDAAYELVTIVNNFNFRNF